MACGTPQHCATSAPRGWPVPQKRHSCAISCNVSPVALKFGLEEVGSCRGHILLSREFRKFPSCVFDVRSGAEGSRARAGAAASARQTRAASSVGLRGQQRVCEWACCGGGARESASRAARCRRRPPAFRTLPLVLGAAFMSCGFSGRAVPCPGEDPVTHRRGG